MDIYLDWSIFQRFLIAIALGALIGIEREMHSGEVFREQKLAGLRTFILIALFGAASAFISELFPAFLLIAFVCLVLFLVAGHIMASLYTKDIGLTTEVTAVLTFILGVMCYLEYEKIAIAVSILIVLFLSLREPLHKFVKNIKQNELYATLRFAIIAFVILPFLPNKAYDPYGVLNPYIIWLMVVLISAISFFGYIIIKIVGAKKGIGVTGFLGGLVSSTAVTLSMSHRSKEMEGKLVNPFIFATVIASAIMFIRIIIEVTVINKSLLQFLWIPMGAMALTAGVLAFIVWHSKGKGPVKSDVKFDSPFRIAPALKFAAFFVFILFISKIASMYLGNLGIYAASLLSGLADVDAITLSVSQLAGKDISTTVAVTAITLAAIANMVTKGIMAYLFGARKFGKTVLIIFGVVIVVGLAVLFLL